MSSTNPISTKRTKFLILIVLIIFLLGYIALVIIENMNLIDAFYFLIVTITTVGFGDITPETSSGKFIVSILIIVSISSIALLSEQIINQIISINTQKYLELTSKLDYEDHIIICGFTNIAKNIAELFQDRFFRIVILDPHVVAVERARDNNLEAYVAVPQERKNLEQVNISQAMALYLFMDDENANVLTSLQARNIAGDDLLIYASTEHELSIQLGNLIGITRTYHYERIVASNIRFSLQRIIAFSLPNQLTSPQAKFVQILVRPEFDYVTRFSTYYIVGTMDRTLTHFTPIEEIDNVDHILEQGGQLMLSIPRELVPEQTETMIDNISVIGEKSIVMDKLIVGGYNDTARHIVQELDPSILLNLDFQILCFSKNEAELAKNDGHSVIVSKREDVRDKLSTICTPTTLIVNLFDRLTDSLLVNTLIEKLDTRIYTVQLAFDRIETDVLIKSGVDRILIPDVLMSRGMFLILLATKGFMNSMIWGNVHIFEHYLDTTSPLVGKRVNEIQKLGYIPLLYRTKSGKIVEHVGNRRLLEGDNILLYKKHTILTNQLQLIDHTH